ncbi:2-oxoacid:acceptor oxidoreductase family protein [Acidobacteriota bacterium]
MEIRITGFGGQGIILAGVITGKGASVFNGKFATLIESYGPEARGSACNAQVIISDERILYPYLRKQDILLALSQEGYDTYIGQTSPEGVVLHDTDLVEIAGEPGVKVIQDIPSTRIADEMGRRMVANIVMLGFFTAITGVISKNAMLKAVKVTVPRGTESLNAKAFLAGFDYRRK